LPLGVIGDHTMVDPVEDVHVAATAHRDVGG
jgi:hypothetical protein